MKEACDFPSDFNINRYELFQGKPMKIIQDQDVLHLGGREIQVIHTPVHSPGHVYLFEKERGYLYSGDIVYEGMLYAFYPTTDPKAFYESIQKINKLSIQKILPGHHK